MAFHAVMSAWPEPISLHIRPDWLERKTIHLDDVIRGAYASEYLALSYRLLSLVYSGCFS